MPPDTPEDRRSGSEAQAAPMPPDPLEDVIGVPAAVGISQDRSKWQWGKSLPFEPCSTDEGQHILWRKVKKRLGGHCTETPEEYLTLFGAITEKQPWGTRAPEGMMRILQEMPPQTPLGKLIGHMKDGKRFYMAGLKAPNPLEKAVMAAELTGPEAEALARDSQRSDLYPAFAIWRPDATAEGGGYWTLCCLAMLIKMLRLWTVHRSRLEMVTEEMLQWAQGEVQEVLNHLHGLPAAAGGSGSGACGSGDPWPGAEGGDWQLEPGDEWDML